MSDIVNSDDGKFEQSQISLEQNLESKKSSPVPKWQIVEVEKRLKNYNKGKTKSTNAFEALDRIRKKLLP